MKKWYVIRNFNVFEADKTMGQSYISMGDSNLFRDACKDTISLPWKVCYCLIVGGRPDFYNYSHTSVYYPRNEDCP